MPFALEENLSPALLRFAVIYGVLREIIQMKDRVVDETLLKTIRNT